MHRRPEVSRQDLPELNNSSERRGLALGQTTAGLLKASARLIDLLDTPEDIPFLEHLIEREIIYRILRTPRGERLRAIATSGEPESENGKSHCVAEHKLRQAPAYRGTSCDRADGVFNTISLGR
jgi:AraC-type transcriptional regulator N-terminus